MRGYNEAGVVDQIRGAGGEVYAVTSEPQSLASNAEVDWSTGMTHLGDPHQEILGTCRDKGWLTLFTSDWGEGIVRTETSWMSHPKGYYQPGVLALANNGRVLYRWRCRPNRQNVGGAIARPTATHVWRHVQTALEQPADAADAPHDDNPELDAKPAPWPLFVTLLLANGWFMRPKSFAYQPGKDTVGIRQRNAMLRIPLFAAFWALLFLLLPLWLVALLLVAWVTKITPGVIAVHQRFQNVRPDEEPV